MKSDLKWKIRILILVFFSALPVHAIVGGFEIGDSSSFLSVEEQAKIASHVVALIDTTSTLSFRTCTATLVAPHLALTAAHCVTDVALDKLFIVSSVYSSAVLARHAVLEVFTPDEYKTFDLPTLQKPNSDLTIIRFAGDLPANYHPVAWTDFTYDQSSVWTFVAGYGTSSNSNVDSGSLRIAKVTNPRIDGSQSYFIGQQNLGSGVCHGDSGGPVFVKYANDYILIGVTSSVVPRDPLHPELLVADPCFGTSYFNNAYYYRAWISSHSGN
jgi:secreted trypsin-like serine protease